MDIVYADTLSDGTRRLAEFLKQSICREACTPFLTPLYTQGGNRIGDGREALSQEQIISMDYLMENVRGRIPVYEELSPLGKATVEVAGVLPMMKSAAGEGERA